VRPAAVPSGVAVDIDRPDVIEVADRAARRLEDAGIDLHVALPAGFDELREEVTVSELE
jgi:hypothetical protein